MSMDNIYDLCLGQQEFIYKVDKKKDAIMREKVPTTRSEPAAEGAVDLSNRTKRNLEFGKRIYKTVVDMGITQSDLARMSGLGRDSISQYIRGKSVPTPVNLNKLAKALNMEANELYPQYESNAFGTESLSQEMRAVPGDPDHMWLRVDMKVPTAVALEVLQLVNKK